MIEFEPFPKMSRLFRQVIITEKIDGTNACVCIRELTPGQVFDPRIERLVTNDSHSPWYAVRAGSRTRWITPEDDNYGFAAWVWDNNTDLAKLGPGTHFGEWWGSGCQRGYGLSKGEKRFSLFNTLRWCAYDASPIVQISEDPRVIRTQTPVPPCCHVVPELYRGVFSTVIVDSVKEDLRKQGSAAAPGFMRPEGVVVFHTAANTAFKSTLEKDDQRKGAGN